VDRYRKIMLGLGTALTAVVIGGFLLASGSGEAGNRGVIEALSPEPGALVPGQSRIEVDIPVGYRIELSIEVAGNWFTVPASELVFIEGTGAHSWSPGPGRVVEAWEPGTHHIRVAWNTATGIPDVGEYEWSFRSY
jgi:hypothetical protein